MAWEIEEYMSCEEFDDWLIFLEFKYEKEQAAIAKANR